MTALNFPDSPSNGATYQGYTYNSTKGTWAKPAVTDARTAVYANIAALPTSGTAGDMAYVTATNRLYIWTGTGWYNIALINNNPTISGVSATYDLAIDGTATTVTMTATDPEGLPITYSIASDTSGNTATVVQGTGANTNVFTITPSTNTAHAGTFSLTFRASDGVNIASAAASFTLQFSVQNSKYTSSLITSIGANNAVNTAFDDKSTSNHTITANGDATQTTFSPYRHGGYSAYFDGNGDYLQIANHADNDLSSGDWTVELWAYVPSAPAVSGNFFSKGTYVSTYSYSFAVLANGSLLFESGNGNWSSTNTTSTAGDFPFGQWNHVALVRNGTSIDMYCNGSRVKNITSASMPTNTSDAFRIGAFTTHNDYYFTGYIRDFRLIKGTAVYTGTSYTVPTEPLTAITNTKLLTCHLPYIADGSTTGHSIAVNGNTKTVPFAPYDSQKYSVASHAGSLHSDGSGDYLAVDASSDFDLGTSDFTIEGWVYPTSYGSGNFLLGQNYFSSVLQINSGKLQFYSSPASAYIITAATDIPLNAWTHWALVRNGNAWTIYLNGKSDATATNAADAGFDSTNPLHIMRWNNNNGTIAGNVADFRFVKGTAVYTSNFTPPTAPLTAVTNTKLLVQSTDAGIIDKGQSAQDLRLFGNTKSSTTQNKFLTSSIYFDGSGDYIKWTNDEAIDWGIGGEPFTLEWWQWWPSIVNERSVGPQTGGGTAGWNGTSGHQWTMFTYSGSANLFMQWWNGSGRTDYEFSHGGALTASTWQHFAVVYDGTNLSLYIDGSRITHRTSGNTFGTVTNRHGILGGNGSYGGQSEIYYSDVRITKGLARYSGTSLTVPTEALKG